MTNAPNLGLIEHFTLDLYKIDHWDLWEIRGLAAEPSQECRNYGQREQDV